MLQRPRRPRWRDVGAEGVKLEFRREPLHHAIDLLGYHVAMRAILRRLANEDRPHAAAAAAGAFELAVDELVRALDREPLTVVVRHGAGS
ncbi:MAG TPA: hypothetical protein VFZ65_01225 [Planctomycetota bacterium]|nr:hypothetical protein [Planctomycetota bacterium]